MNFEAIKGYFDVILKERDWSWALIGIMILVSMLVVRHLFIAPVVHKAKELNRTPYEEFKKAYLKRALFGWIFFLASFGLMIGLWGYGVSLPLSMKAALALLASIMSFILSILFHLQALGVAAVVALKRVSEKEADL